MPSRIVFEGSHSTCFAGDKPDICITLTEITSSHYQIERNVWNSLTTNWSQSGVKRCFDCPSKPAVIAAQQKISGIRSTTEKYLTAAFLAAWICDRWYFKGDHTFTILGRSYSTDILALSTWGASFILTRIAAKTFEWKASLRDPLKALQQKLKFSKFQKTAGLYATIAFTVTTVIGICLYNKSSVTKRLENFMDSKTVFLLSGISMIASVLAIKYFDRQKENTEHHAQQLAKWVVNEFDRINPNVKDQKTLLDLDFP